MARTIRVRVNFAGRKIGLFFSGAFIRGRLGATVKVGNVQFSLDSYSLRVRRVDMRAAFCRSITIPATARFELFDFHPHETDIVGKFALAGELAEIGNELQEKFFGRQFSVF